MEWGLCPPPAQGVCPRAAGSRRPLHPLPGQLTEPPLRGTHSPSFTGLLCHILSLGSSGRLVPLKQIQPHVTRAAFLGHTHHLLVHSPLRPERSPRAPSPPGSVWALTPLWPGLSLSQPPQGHQELPPPRAGCLPCPGEASVVSGLRNNRFLCGLPHTAQRPAPAYQPLPCGWAQGCPRGSH